MKEEAVHDVKEIKRNGISVRIRPTLKDGTTYFVADHRVHGQRKLVWRSSLAKARDAANKAIDKISEGQAEVLNLTGADAHSHIRAKAKLDGAVGETRIEKTIDEVVGEYAEIYRLLNGRATPLEVTRDWLKRHAVSLPKITVAAAVTELKLQAESDGKSSARRKQLAAGLDAFALGFNYQEHGSVSRSTSPLFRSSDNSNASEPSPPLGVADPRSNRNAVAAFSPALEQSDYAV